jgi:glucose-6-phosphate 1-dehydrogenase
MTEQHVQSEPALFVIFGGTGDLAKRKLLPALANIDHEGCLADRSKIVAVGRSPMDDEAFRASIGDALARAGFDRDRIRSASRRIHYQALSYGREEDYRALAKRLQELGRDMPANHAFYMALPPQAFARTAAGLGAVGLNGNEHGWTRLVVEKPFGEDLASARKLNRLLHEHFDERQIYRIDHFLGKETVQNLLVFRLANAFIESSWNRERIEAIQISVAEHIGIGKRSQYYNRAGAIRDMVQNHLTQLLTLVAMEVPISFSADAIRSEKIKVLHAIQPLGPESAVRGQYTAGSVDGANVPGYREEDGVPIDSTTETFVAMRVCIDSWRWQGVPFYLRTGKRMPASSTQIAVRFRKAPVRFFKQYGCVSDTHDVLTITLQPEQGFTFYLGIKRPGTPLELERIPLSFRYDQCFGGVLRDAYQTLLLDVLVGDQTLFVHADEVEASWRVYAPLLDEPIAPRPYPAGTWGPHDADRFAIPETDIWQRSTV